MSFDSFTTTFEILWGLAVIGMVLASIERRKQR